jgi:hypothetical protein
MLSVDLREIGNEESIFSVGLAAVDVNVAKHLLQLRVKAAVEDGLVAVERLDVIVLIVERRRIGSQALLVGQSNVRGSHRQRKVTRVADGDRLLRVTRWAGSVEVGSCESTTRHDESRRVMKNSRKRYRERRKGWKRYGWGRGRGQRMVRSVSFDRCGNASSEYIPILGGVEGRAAVLERRRSDEMPGAALSNKHQVLRGEMGRAAAITSS